MPEHDKPRLVRRIDGLAEIASRYDVILCDIWGVLHDGVKAFAPASGALASFRRGGGTVILITNAPRPSAPVRRQLLKLGVSPDAFDDVATSGDVTIGMIAEQIDEPVLHIGPARDLSLFEAAAAAAGRAPHLAGLSEAAYALCTGLRDDVVETPEDYEAELEAMLGRSMTMICANPDIVIHRGDTLIYCAGALAARFEAMGGAVVYAGKPYPPIYRRAVALAEKARCRPVESARVLAVGDGMRTDIAGAAQSGLDALFVTHGIHRSALHDDLVAAPADEKRLRSLYEEHALWPAAAIRALED